MASISNEGKYQMNAPRKGSFAASFAAIFLVTFVGLSFLGLVPEGVRQLNGAALAILGGKSTLLSADSSKESDTLPVDKTLVPSKNGEVPKAIVVPSINLSAPIQTPESTDVLVLDDALRFGPVQYPGSANLGEVGNMFIFGHSSELKVVNNQAFKVFNRINQLKIGSEIIVRSESLEYVYTVSRVSLVDQSKELVDLGGSGKKLTLSTCNSFGAKTERYVVEADFVRSYPIAG
jgi:LPXTG-site transpeptidase (sortase) family protein